MNTVKKWFVAGCVALLAAVSSAVAAPVASAVSVPVAAVSGFSLVGALSSFGSMLSSFFATIDLGDFTTALGEVGTAVTNALGATVTAGLAIAGVIMGGLLLWKLFRRIAKA